MSRKQHSLIIFIVMIYNVTFRQRQSYIFLNENNLKIGYRWLESNVCNSQYYLKSPFFFTLKIIKYNTYDAII